MKRMLSKACKYAINSMIFLAAQSESDRRFGIKEISSAINSPEAFTAKILQVMVKENLLSSIKGPNGGFEINESGKNATIYRIVQLIDGDSIFMDCALGLAECSETHPCALHSKFQTIRDHLTGMMMSTTLRGLASGIQDGRSFLKI